MTLKPPLKKNPATSCGFRNTTEYKSAKCIQLKRGVGPRKTAKSESCLYNLSVGENWANGHLKSYVILRTLSSLLVPSRVWFWGDMVADRQPRFGKLTGVKFANRKTAKALLKFPEQFETNTREYTVPSPHHGTILSCLYKNVQFGPEITRKGFPLSDPKNTRSDRSITETHKKPATFQNHLSAEYMNTNRTTRSARVGNGTDSDRVVA